MDLKRVRILKKSNGNGPVVYWMSRDQRINDNWALVYAQQLALEFYQPLIVVFCLVPTFLEATIRQYEFMLSGLEHVQTNLIKKSIPFVLLSGNPAQKIPEFITQHKVGTVVTDFDPLKIKREWKNSVISKSDVSFYEVDAHNVVPCFYASSKQEFGARTIRTKINSKLQEFLTEFPIIVQHPHVANISVPTDWTAVRKSLSVNMEVKPISWLSPGEDSAISNLNSFISDRLDMFEAQRNDPSKDSLSNLSPYLHFGQISAQRVALEIATTDSMSKEPFLEELIVRKELADNYCFYNENYDNFEGFPNWAKTTLNAHRTDIRPRIFSLEQLELAQTYDDLWNASQMEMMIKGKMHGYMRMYWAKKILEWTASPEEALRIAIYLNDKYEVDGRDPNGYTGIAWSIGGLHDRAWGERPVFGKVRYMSYNGAKSKFDIKAYIRKVDELIERD